MISIGATCDRRGVKSKLLCPLRDVSRILGVHSIVLPRCEVEKSVVAVEETMWIWTGDTLEADEVIIAGHGIGSIEEHHTSIGYAGNDHELSVVQENDITNAL